MSQTSKRAREETEESENDFPPAKLSKTSESPSSPDNPSIAAATRANLVDAGDVVPTEVRSALDVLRAIELAPSVLPQLGSCPLQLQMLLGAKCYGDDESIYEYADVEKFEQDLAEEHKRDAKRRNKPTTDIPYDPDKELIQMTAGGDAKMTKEKLKELRRIQAVLNKWKSSAGNVSVRSSSRMVKDVEEDLGEDSCTVTIKLPSLQQSLGKESSGESTFRLRDFYAPVSQFMASGGEEAKRKESTPGDSNDPSQSSGDVSLLERLFEIGDVSPFGKSKTCETVVDKEIHKARQIDANHFTVSPSLISKVEKIWSKFFLPSSVEAVPYKLKVYDREGHFSRHKDTPETGLVGTFLVGLTDPDGIGTEGMEHLDFEYVGMPHLDYLGSNSWNSESGTWCAFYPDVDHRVVTISDDIETENAKNGKRDYRGTIAFKLFANAEPPMLSYSALELLDKVEKPLGILLRHDYSIDCHMGVLKGADAALFATLSKLDSCRLLLLPVITTLYWDRGVEDECEKGEASGHVNVYPFTEAMIRAALERTNKETASKQCPIASRCIPFVTTKQWNSGTLANEFEYAGDLGNQAYPMRQDSVYISAAILLLPL